ncbi:cytochrome b5 isoform X2 [Calliopsis andreniformis]
MDLLSLTFRSFHLRDSIPHQEGFVGLGSGSVIEVSKQSKEEPRASTKEEPKEIRTINLDEVAWHDTADSCWIVIHDFVYDCTDFLRSHPGGSDVILEYAGRDGTLAFIGTGHSSNARQILKKYLIGELPPEERIFRVPNGVKVAGY